MTARTADPVKTRVHGQYRGMVARFAEKRWKSGRRQGKIRTVGVALPFSEADLLVWVQRRFPLGCALPCPYCGTPIDAFNMSLDHASPISRGGAVGLVNLEAICERCNRLKGGLDPGEFKELMEWLYRQHPAAQADLMKRLLAGAMGMRIRYFK